MAVTDDTVLPDQGTAPNPTDEERARVRERNELVRAMDRVLTDMRQRSYEGKLTTPARWKKLALAPAGMRPAAFAEQVLDYIEGREHADASPAVGAIEAPAPLEVLLEGRDLSEDDPLPEPEVHDVVLLYGKKGIYLYSKALMSASFARALFLTAEDDDLATFVDVVRTESSVYPRPVSVDAFMMPPYLWAPTHVEKLFSQVETGGSFTDIHTCRASNGKVHYYSDLYLSAAQARALAEWYEVEKPRNP